MPLRRTESESTRSTNGQKSLRLLSAFLRLPLPILYYFYSIYTCTQRRQTFRNVQKTLFKMRLGIDIIAKTAVERLQFHAISCISIERMATLLRRRRQ